MTDQQLIIAVAKLDGLTCKASPTIIGMYALFSEDGSQWSESHDTEEQCWREAKDYLTSHDAIIPVIEKHITNPEIEMIFNYALYDLLQKEVSEVNAMTYVMAVKATARQLSIALLKACGKWEEREEVEGYGKFSDFRD